jgi:hypothetical protein
MNWTQLWVALGLALPAYFLWSLLHELSHVAGAKLVVGVMRWDIRPWPQFQEGRLVWGYATYTLSRTPLQKEEAMILLAPRAADLVGVVGFGLTPLFAGVWLAVWGVLFGAGLVDLVVGSLGVSPASDLRRASEALGWSPWRLRLAGVAAAVLSAGAVVVLMAVKN